LSGEPKGRGVRTWLGPRRRWRELEWMSDEHWGDNDHASTR
jgi:hypothetical protein